MEKILFHAVNLYFRIPFLPRVLWSVMSFSFILLVLLLFFPAENVTTEPVGWERSYSITGRNIKARNVRVASRGKHITAVYEGKEEDRKGIYVSVSLDGGLSFLKAIRISDGSATVDNNPEVCVSGEGKVTVLWHDLVGEDLSNRIFYVHSTDLGATWSETRQLNFGNDLELLPRGLYGRDGALHLFFHAFRGDRFNLYHVTSKDGENFTEARPLSAIKNVNKGAFFPSIALSGRYIYIVWQGKGNDFKDDLFFMRSVDEGESWTTPKKLTASPQNDASPSLLVSGDRLFVVYRNNDDKNWKIKLLTGRLRGDVWDSEPLTVSTTDSDCYNPHGVFSNGKIYIIWQDFRQKRPSVYLRKYNIKDKKLTKAARISRKKASAVNPKIIKSGARSIVFWEGGGRIAVKYSDIYAPPPKVYSKTHPKDKWSRETTAIIQWKAPKDPSGIVGYATITGKETDISRVLEINPTIMNVKAGVKTKVIPRLEDGITYFHIRAVDGAGNMSRTIHYPVKVSSTPLPLPVIVSETHPQGKAVNESKAVLKWAVDDLERLKGFYYSLSKDKAEKPDIFTTEFSHEEDNLLPGRYFFTLQAVDRTKMKSQTATYLFFVGKDAIVDPEYLKQLAKRDLEEDTEEDKTKKKRRKRRRRPKPAVVINLPIDENTVHREKNLDAVIELMHVPPKRILGYSVEIDRVEREPDGIVDISSGALHLTDLGNGDYFLSVRGKYRSRRGKIRWTKTRKARFTVSIPPSVGPYERTIRHLERMITPRALPAALFMLVLAVSIATIGYGSRFVFYIKKIQYNLRLLFKM